MLVLVKDYCPDPWMYFKPITSIKRSKPAMSIDAISDAKEPEKPYPFNDKPDLSVGGAFADIADIADAVLRSVTAVFD